MLAAGHEVVLVLTQPDRASGRGLKPSTSAVKRLASARGIALLQPDSLKSAEAAARVHAVAAEVIVAAAYGLILPAALLTAAEHGALNIHASLLPRWRGAAPIQRAILAGDSETGISIMQMDAGLDTGPVLLRRRLRIAADDDAGSLHEKLALLGAQSIVDALREVEAGRAQCTPQGEEGVTYARKIDKRETMLDWTRPALELERAVRAFRPSPGASALLGQETLKIWRARVVSESGNPGTLLSASDALIVASAEGALAISELQRPGGKRMDARQFLRGHPLSPGVRFGMPQ